ncbi:Uncharacterized conserved protein, tellurite resistance protein B (TerB) family [Cognatiyoonia sediminum]|uniref:Uncharacterized conserved protein, tellurite resistance protein B (TerB) family n=1 Tax=Cognatiyoonia sediminum TaxID=1508389 RepID=A0A1M5L3S2_9RHOB|nr:TerB family tellurite resistance protein [Cognatiyoonia sediminum]SHG59742.1 Uncharacterized conserved protein, tellurite resistance protein B (TerB) family [Cognatiyoonia sediminum]
MFSALLNRLMEPTEPQVADDDARLALGALLVRIARSDDDYAQVEKDQIKAVLAARYGLSDATGLLADCEALEAEAPDTVRFTRAIKDGVAYEDRIGVVEDMWAIVLADGVRDAHENQIMRMVPPMIGVEDQDSNAARRRIETRG